MTYKEFKTKSIDIIDERIEELFKRECDIIERLSYSLPEDMRNMTTGVRMMQFREMSIREDDPGMRRDLNEIDNLRFIIKELVDMRNKIRKLN